VEEAEVEVEAAAVQADPAVEVVVAEVVVAEAVHHQPHIWRLLVFH